MWDTLVYGKTKDKFVDIHRWISALEISLNFQIHKFFLGKKYYDMLYTYNYHFLKHKMINYILKFSLQNVYFLLLFLLLSSFLCQIILSGNKRKCVCVCVCVVEELPPYLKIIQMQCFVWFGAHCSKCKNATYSN